MKTRVMILTFAFLLMAFHVAADSSSSVDDNSIQSDTWNIKVLPATGGGEEVQVLTRDTGKLLATYKPSFRTEHFDSAEEVNLEKFSHPLIVLTWDSGPHGQVLVVINPNSNSNGKADETKQPLYELESSGPITFYEDGDHIAINYYALDNPRGDSLDKTWKPDSKH